MQTIISHVARAASATISRNLSGSGSADNWPGASFIHTVTEQLSEGVSQQRKGGREWQTGGAKQGRERESERERAGIRA